MKKKNDTITKTKASILENKVDIAEYTKRVIKALMDKKQARKMKIKTFKRITKTNPKYKTKTCNNSNHRRPSISKIGI